MVPSERIFMSSFHLKQRFLLHPVIHPAHGVGQKPADGHAPPDACHPDRRDGGQRIGQHHAGAQGYHRQHHRHTGPPHSAVQPVEQEQTADARIERALNAQVAHALGDDGGLRAGDKNAHQQRGKHKHQCADRDAEPDGRRKRAP